MRYLMLNYGDQDSEASVFPEPGVIEKINALVAEAAEKGVLEAGEGLLPTSHAMKVRYEDGQFHVTDGPFTESKEIIASFVIFNLNSREEALEWSRRFYEIIGKGGGEIRPISEFEAPQPE